MSEFYNSLAEKMQSGSCVVMTVLEGESAGKKLLVTEPVEQYEGHAVFCERAGSQPRLVICGAVMCPIPMIRMGKMLGFQGDRFLRIVPNLRTMQEWQARMW